MEYVKYTKTQIDAETWVITEKGKDYKSNAKAVTFAFDTETLTYFDGKIVTSKALLKKTMKLTTEQKRKRLASKVWAWQCYDEVNGFFMTNNFYEWLEYQARHGLKFGWCYNAKFDFSQIDYEILAKGRDKWTPHVHDNTTKGQAWTYESLHSDCGARYSYKLWIEYRNANRHRYAHAVEYKDFMNIVTGGLAKMLEGLDVRDADGQPLRKLKMDYQAVNPNELTEEEIDYTCIDVKGLYYGVKQFNETIEEQSDGESHIFGEKTNVMTAGGFAKRELLRSLYPNKKAHKFRVEAYKRQHPITQEQDEYLRKYFLYRGGIVYVNPKYQGKLVTASYMGQPMRRYDVNSEYPYAMNVIRDLIGKPFVVTFEEWQKMKQDDYEAVYVLNSIYGEVKAGYLGVWYDPFKRDYVDVINEQGTHLIFERELFELLEWYDNVEFDCEKIILWRRGDYVYKPFVDENYKLKAEAKKQGKPTLAQIAKLKLNSSYGKLSERIERVTGHYELNEQTGAIHFIRDGVESDESGALNVAVGALVTSVARCYILSKIREICGSNGNVIKDTFVYIDTDSIHAFADYDKADAYTLGGLKLEATCEAIKYIAPKTYIDIEKIGKDGTIDYKNIEIHSKGVSLSAIIADLKKKQKGKKKGKPTLALLDKKIAYGAQYVCLCAMNVQGGKLLLPTLKYLARPETAPTDDERIYYTNYDGAILSEI